MGFGSFYGKTAKNIVENMYIAALYRASIVSASNARVVFMWIEPGSDCKLLLTN